MSSQQRNQIINNIDKEYIGFLKPQFKSIVSFLQNTTLDKKEKAAILKETKILIQLNELLKKIKCYSDEEENITAINEKIDFIASNISSKELKKKSNDNKKKWKTIHDNLLKTASKYIELKKKLM